jgi:RimJ/RimL family protein N-acetyltransferase
MNPEKFNTTETLKNGLTVTIRAIRPADKAAVAEAFNRLAPESVYTRFFQVRRSLSDRELKAATEVDFEKVVALVVTVTANGNETIIGGGRYATIDPSRTPRRAEIAFLVEEDFHGQGIAGRILKHLAQIAREKGISQFEAEVLPQNKAMLAVFARSGLRLEQRSAEGVVHVTLSLNDRRESA